LVCGFRVKTQQSKPHSENGSQGGLGEFTLIMLFLDPRCIYHRRSKRVPKGKCQLTFLELCRTPAGLQVSWFSATSVLHVSQPVTTQALRNSSVSLRQTWSSPLPAARGSSLVRKGSRLVCGFQVKTRQSKPHSKNGSQESLNSFSAQGESGG
jgi:hypothetical protein